MMVCFCDRNSKELNGLMSRCKLRDRKDQSECDNYEPKTHKRECLWLAFEEYCQLPKNKEK